MKKSVFLLLSLILAATTIQGQSSLVWMRVEDLVDRSEPSMRRVIGDFTIVELPRSSLERMDERGIFYETIDATIEEEDTYWLAWDPRSQGFDQLHHHGHLLGIFGDAAVLTGDPAAIGEQVPGLGFELERLVSRPSTERKAPFLGGGAHLGLVDSVSADSIEAHIRWLENFGTRYALSYECSLAAYALEQKFLDYGYQVELVSFPLWDPGLRNFNVVATLPGDEIPDVVYIICGHYDSISNDPYNSAPGADDNASGTAAVIEAARVLKGYSPAATVKFICFGGEELGLYGSWHYAGYADSVGMDIRGVLNFDMIAYCDIPGTFDLNVHTDGNSEPLADLFIAQGEQTPDLVLYKILPGGGGSDHVPFQSYGFPAILAIERASHHWNPYYHSTDDTTGTLTIPFATETVKLGVAGLLRLALFVPEVTVYDAHWVDSGDDGHAEPLDTLSLTLELLNSGRGAADVEARIRSNDQYVTLIDTVSSFGGIATDSMEDNSTDPFVIAINPDSPIHVCTLEIAITADSLDFQDTTFITIGIPPVLVLDDDGGGSYDSYFTTSLERIGVLYDLLRPDGGVTTPYVSEYSAVIWLTGDNSSVTDTLAIAALSEYLNSGGNLFVSGQDVESCVDAGFYHDYLHADLVEDSTYSTRVDGIPGDAIGDGLAFLILGAPGANNQATPSIISPLSGADSVFEYWTGGCAGVKYGGTYRTVYLSYGFEAINPLSAADSLLSRALRWFEIPIGIEQDVVREDSSPLGPSLKVHPIPSVGEFQISYALNGPEIVRLDIYDSAGRIVKRLETEHKGPGTHRIRWDGDDRQGRQVPGGIYFCRMEVEGTGESNSDKAPWRATKKLILLR